MRTHQDKIEQGIDKAGDLANQKTGSKHDQRIRSGTGHLRDGLSKITGNPSTTNRGGDAPPGPVIDHDPREGHTSGHDQPGPKSPRT